MNIIMQPTIIQIHCDKRMKGIKEMIILKDTTTTPVLNPNNRLQYNEKSQYSKISSTQIS